MVFFYKSSAYSKNLADAPEERSDVEKKILELSRRQKIQDGKNPKWYSKNIWVLKIMGQGRNSRVIFQEIVGHGLKEDCQLIVIRDYISQKRYEPYWRNRIEPMVDKGEYLTNFPLSDDEKESAIQALRQEINKPVPPKDKVPPEMANWLYDFGIDHHFSVYESSDWSNREHMIKIYISDIFALIKKVLFEESVVAKNRRDIPGRSVWEATDESVTILYEKTGLIGEEGREVLESLLLHNWWNRGTQSEDIEEMRRRALEYPGLQGIKNEIYTRDLISKGAYRGYPGLIFKQNSKEAWERIQINSNKSNLALAPEQENILKRFQFPSFINGQAGSGKSEMLMYLFAELCFRKECEDIKGNVVFLTENEELLERALLDTIEKLSFNSQYSSYGFDKIKIKNNFNTFRGFILENLINSEDQDKYKELKYINFSNFKQRYLDSRIPQNIKKKYPAEIAWFIIMTFIRGYDAENEELTPEKFEQVIHRKELSFVDNDTYKEVFEKIWTGFYKKILEEGYWDRLSLVQHVLREYVDVPADKKYSVLVCDEAQDFTKLELQLLIKLSRYSDYDLSGLNRVPIAFAGDPFQTVNPTGINLRQIRKLFWDELVNKFNLDLNIEDLLSNLTNNYRSTPEIVNLANVLQYIRHRFLRLNDLENPQTPRMGSNKKHPSLFRLEEAESQELGKKLNYAIFISPCNQGEEKEYKRNDDWLEEGMVLKSAALAKGSEYPIVCVYKFGDEFIREFGEDFLEGLLSQEEFYKNLNNGDQFRVNFFFNKLYVAITRAQNELYILDSTRGSRFFWKYFRSHENLVGEIVEPSWCSINFSECYADGNSATIGVLDFKIALQNASSDVDSGLLYEDKDKMRDAARMYGLLGSDYKDRKEFCLAKALEFEHSYKEAGDKFRDCNVKQQGFDRKEAASKCYWIGGYWTELLDLHGNDADKEEYKIRNTVSRLMLNRNFDIQTVIQFKNKIQAAICEEKSCAGKIDWEDKFYEKLVDYIGLNKEKFAGKISDLALSLDSFSKKTNNLNNLIADLYFADKNYRKAIEKWQEIDDLEHNRYSEAAAEAYRHSDPDKAIFYLNKLREKEQLFDIYRNNSKGHLSTDSLGIVCDLFYAQSDNKSWRELVDIYYEHDLPFKTLFDRLRKEPNENRTKVILIIDFLANRFVSLPLSTRLDWPINDFIGIVNHILGAPRISSLTQNIGSAKPDKSKATEASIKSCLQSNDWIHDFMSSFIRIIAHSNLEVGQTQEIISTASFNYLYYTERKNRKKLKPIEIIAFVDKVFKKFAEKQRLYSELDSFLMRDDELDLSEKMIIERRFWKIRYERVNYDIGQKGDKGVEEIQAALEHTKKIYPNLKFQLGAPSIDYLRKMPASPVVDQLLDDLAEVRRQQEKKKEKTIPNPIVPANTKNNEMQELKEMISQLSEQMELLREENRKLQDKISDQHNENRKLHERNEKLQEKLMKYL